MTKWTEDEVKYLKENYGETDNQKLMEVLDRSEEAVKAKSKRLGLQKRDNHYLLKRIESISEPEYNKQGFNDFICGFVAGEGSFISRTRQTGSKRFSFQIALAEVDESILHQIRDYLGCGRIYTWDDKRKSDWQRKVTYVVEDIPNNYVKIRKFFKNNELRNTHKQEQFEEWCEELENYV